MQQTQVINERVAFPWFEFLADGESEPEAIAIEATPFVIGRNDSCELTVESTRVSREHAFVEQEGKAYLLRDQGSTNGTYVNGERVDEAELRDGDIVVFADVEYAFRCVSQSGARQTVTQVIEDKDGPAVASHESSSWSTIREIRRMHESTTSCGVRNSFEPIINLVDSSVHGYRAANCAGHLVENQLPDSIRESTECRLLGRLQQIQRMVAVEQSRQLPENIHLFLPVAGSEVGDESLIESLRFLSSKMDANQSLVVDIPESAACNIPYFRDFLMSLKDMEIAVSYHGFVGGRGQINHFQEIAPDYLTLGNAMTREVGNNSSQRQLQGVVRTAQEIGCDVIASAIADPASLDLLRDLGCRFAQGPVVGAPQTIESLVSVVG